MTLYCDASASFISPLQWIRNKDDKPKRILTYVLTTQQPPGNALPLFERITSEHSTSIRKTLLRFKETELKLSGNYKVPSRVETHFSKAMMQAVLQEYLGENIE